MCRVMDYASAVLMVWMLLIDEISGNSVIVRRECMIDIGPSVQSARDRLRTAGKAGGETTFIVGVY